MNKSIFLTTVEKCLIKDLINIQINEVIEDQRKRNLKDRRNGTLVKGEPIKNLDKWDTDEVYYIDQLEKLKKKFKLSHRQETIEQKYTINGESVMKKWKAISIDNKKICSFKTKKEVIHCLKESYLKDHVPFFELDSQGRLDGFTFKEFLTDFKITRV